MSETEHDPYIIVPFKTVEAARAVARQHLRGFTSYVVTHPGVTEAHLEAIRSNQERDSV